MPMGCALCGHAPYAHGCPGQGADHDYAQPSRELMAVRLEARRLGVPLPASEAFADAEIIPLVPAQRRPEQPAPAAPTPLPKRTSRPFPRQTSAPPSSHRRGATTADAPPHRDPAGPRGPPGTRPRPVRPPPSLRRSPRAQAHAPSPAARAPSRRG
ncbi:hypothetical protein [Streptosporangium amethystogenes]|uniref:hypothetical protein n=1 Tax=Streptosporangium amethystogenes TaxID=2002 RepID=UPI0012F9C851|nr:hypothetical protein [Streptosporangium amethystogenes]